MQLAAVKWTAAIAACLLSVCSLAVARDTTRARLTGNIRVRLRNSAINATTNETQPSHHTQQYFAICLCVKGQHSDIREWIQYHISLGSMIYLWDDNSSEPLQPLVQDFIDAGQVRYHFLLHDQLGAQQTQLYVYDSCLLRYGHQHSFMGFIDVDEFIVLKKRQTDLTSFLRQFEDYGALVVNWQLFGSSGHIAKPNTGTLASYTKCLAQQHGLNTHVKTIANTRYTMRVGADPHHFVFSQGKYAVNERFDRVDGALAAYVSVDDIALHHYVIKSAEDFQEKVKRGSAMGNRKSPDFFAETDSLATADCLDAVHLLSTAA